MNDINYFDYLYSDYEYNNQNKYVKAIMSDDIKKVEKVINEDNVNEIFNNIGDSALSISIKNSTPEIIIYLINCGANINTTNDKGDNLFHALSNRVKDTHIKEIFNIILSTMININHKNNKGLTPLSSMIYWFSDNYLLMKQYLENGADPNICIQNDTQLYVTIKNCNIESFELLIDNGADLSHRDKYGTTPSILIETFINNDNAYIYEKNIWTDMLKMIDKLSR